MERFKGFRPKESAAIHDFGRFRVVVAAREIWREGRVEPVQRRVFDLLLYLIENPGRVVAKEEMLDAVWGPVIVTDNVLAQSIKKLRQALGDDLGSPQIVKTVHRIGYRFDPPGVLRAEGQSPSPTPPEWGRERTDGESDAIQSLNALRSLNLRAWRLSSTDHAAALGFAERALALAEQLGHGEQMLLARLFHTCAQMSMGLAAPNQKAIDDALNFYLASGNRVGETRARLVQSAAYYARMDFVQAQACLEPVLPMADMLTDPYDRWALHHSASALLARLGIFERSVRHGLAAVRAGEEIDLVPATQPHVALSAAALAWNQHKSGNEADALRLFRRAYSALGRYRSDLVRQNIALGLGETEYGHGHWQDALTTLAPLLSGPPEGADPILRRMSAAACATAARACLALSELERAEALAIRALELAVPGDGVGAKVAWVRAGLARLSGDGAGELEWLERAEAELSESVDHGLRADVFFQLARVFELRREWQRSQHYVKSRLEEMRRFADQALKAHIELVSLQAKLDAVARERDAALGRQIDSSI